MPASQPLVIYGRVLRLAVDGCSCPDHACNRSVKPGSRVLIADGTLSIEVEEVLSATELRGMCLNGKSLGACKNVNLPGKHVVACGFLGWRSGF